AVLLAWPARDQSRAGPPEARSVRTVTTVRPERRTVGGVVKLPAVVEPIEQTELHARIIGVVQKISVDIGDRVQKGQVLADLGVPEMEAELAHRKAQVRQAQAGVEQARRAVAVAEANVATGRVLAEEAEAGLAHAQGNQERWETEYKRLQALVGK